jgi:hypothetical protein
VELDKLGLRERTVYEGVSGLSDLRRRTSASERGCGHFRPCAAAFGPPPAFSTNGGSNPRDQALLGHKSLPIIARYTHVDSERLRSLVANLWRHPQPLFLFP